MDAGAGDALSPVRPGEGRVHAALAAASAPQHAPLSAALHAERGHALLLLKEYDDALKDCAIAIYSQVGCQPHALPPHTACMPPPAPHV